MLRFLVRIPMARYPLCLRLLLLMRVLDTLLLTLLKMFCSCLTGTDLGSSPSAVGISRRLRKSSFVVVLRHPGPTPGTTRFYMPSVI